jgi:hypothetical protein
MQHGWPFSLPVGARSLKGTRKQPRGIPMAFHMGLSLAGAYLGVSTFDSSLGGLAGVAGAGVAGLAGVTIMVGTNVEVYMPAGGNDGATFTYGSRHGPH